MENILKVPLAESEVMKTFKKYLMSKGIDWEDTDHKFLKTFYEFYKAGWLERQKRTDLSIDSYAKKVNLQ